MTKSTAARAVRKAELKAGKKIVKMKVERKAKRTARKVVRVFLWTAFVFCLGAFAGIHRRVIRAYLTGSKMPKMPAHHPHVFFHKS